MDYSSKETVSFISRAPHILFWFSIPFVLLIGFFGAPQVQLNWKDMNWVIISWEFAFIISIIYMFFGLIYYTLKNRRKRLNTVLTLLHLFCTLDLAILFWIIYLFARKDMDGSYEMTISGFSEMIVVLVLIGQLFFIIQIISSLIRTGLSED